MNRLTSFSYADSNISSTQITASQFQSGSEHISLWEFSISESFGLSIISRHDSDACDSDICISFEEIFDILLGIVEAHVADESCVGRLSWEWYICSWRSRVEGVW